MAGIILTQRNRPDDSKPQGLRAPPSGSLREQTTVVVKVEPSYISSDLFTPFSEPRTTLPSIAEFVRPSYHCDRTWGTTATSYGGVGPASEQFKKKGCGSISRSHRHYGSGCINYSEVSHLMNENVHARMKDSGCNLEVTSRSSHWTRHGQHKKKINQVPIGMETVSALKDVQASLYGTSSYNQNFASTMSTSHRRESAALPLLVTVPELRIHLRTPLMSQGETSTLSDKDEDMSHEESKENNDTTDHFDNSSEKESDVDEREAEDVSSHGHMICTSSGSTILPDHVIVTDLSQLPSHFRRITTKYRRNRCPEFPCQIPFYLLRKRQLLASSITAIPSAMAGERNKATSSHLPFLLNQSKQHRQKITRFYQDMYALPKLGTVARKRPMGGTGRVSMEPGLPQQQPQGVRRYSHMTENLGRRFKTDAHTRYHTHFPERVPDLQPAESSRRHTFYGYHTSVFRG